MKNFYSNILRFFLFGILLVGFDQVYGQTYAFTAPQGYGAGTTGGGNASPVTVTSQSALESALTASGSGVILVSGTISCSYMSVLVNNKTLLGLPGARLRNLDQTATGSGIMNLKPGSSNVIIRNLIFEGPGAYDVDGRDNLTNSGGTKIWVDHCEFQDGMDGNFDNKSLTDNVTISWCKFTYLKAPKAGGSGGTDDHRFSDLIGSSDSDQPSDGKYSITWQYCWWAQGCVERMARARNAQLHMLNCYWNSSVAKVTLGLGYSDCYVENSTFSESGDKYRNYGGTVRLTTTGCTSPPSNVGTCPTPSYSHEAISASAAVSAITGSCGAGATLKVSSSGVVSSSCGGGGTTSNQAPSVSLTSPSNGATFTAPASVSIAATASDADGSVSKVDFYNGSTLLGTDASSPYTFSWTNVAAGTYSITAKATDNSGAVTTSSAVSITVNAPVNQLPTVSITSPANGATFTAPASVSIAATASDADGSISKVDFYNGSTLLGTDASSPYTFSWTNVAAGTYTITAKATDNSGAVTTSSVVSITVNAPANQLPTVSITSPANGATFTAPANVTITAAAADADGTISKVDFYNGSSLLGTDASSPYAFAFNNLAAGTYTLTAKATDNSGAVTTSSVVSITVNAPANQLPTVSITSPANGVSFTAPANVTITATAADADGTISKVDFYNGSTLLGTDVTSPYSFDFNNLAAGAYTLTAKATDNSGAISTSSAINITVNAPGNQAPTVSITSPANNATFAEPATVTITANAADADGTIASVDFYNGATLLGSVTTAPYSFTWSNIAAGTYSITAKATDNNGAVTTSSVVNIAVNTPGNIAPTVSITSPANNAAFTEPANVSITADAADADGTIANVDFYNGATLLGSVSTSPYSFAWNNVAAGTYSITAKATDNNGAVTVSSSVSITVTGISTGSTTLQAETACTVKGILSETKNAGYHGAGYVNVDNAVGTSISWAVNSQGSQTVNLAIRFANGSTVSRNMSLSVNGTIQVPSISFPVTGDFTIWSTANVQVTLADGVNNIVVSSLTSEGGPNIDELTFASSTVTAGSCAPTPPASVTIQAETACTTVGILNETKNSGYHGTGYVNTDNATGASITWSINSPTNQTVGVTIRFANLTGGRAVSVSVNGTTQLASVTFASTGAWTTWSTVNVSLNLVSGTNIIKMTALTSDGCANIDELTFAGTVSAGNCAASLSLAAPAPQGAMVSPNPTTTTFFLTVQEAAQSVTVMDASGFTKFTYGALEAGETLQFGNDLTSGLYIMNIIYTSGSLEQIRLQKTQ